MKLPVFTVKQLNNTKVGVFDPGGFHICECYLWDEAIKIADALNNEARYREALEKIAKVEHENNAAFAAMTAYEALHPKGNGEEER